jgi:primosomal replication protein N
MNRFLLAATLASRAALRYTPAGLPALDLSLQHGSTVSEDGKPRQVSMEIKALAIGDVVQPLAKLALGSAGLFAGFITSTRNGRGLLFHITSFEPDAAPVASPAQDSSSSSN